MYKSFKREHWSGHQGVWEDVEGDWCARFCGVAEDKGEWGVQGGCGVGDAWGGVVYILTNKLMKKERRYILGKATNLTNRLSTYNKSDEHEVV